MKLAEIIRVLESIAPPSLQENYDNSGLITGFPDMVVNKALLTLDCTEAVIEEAEANGCNLVIAHHPIVFRGLKKLTGANYVERTVIAAIRKGIAIYACHTNLDNVLHSGVNLKIAEKLGLKNSRILVPKSGVLQKMVVFVPESAAETVRNAMFQAGAGNIGKYEHCSFNTNGSGTFKAGAGSNPFVGDIGKLHTEPEVRVEVILPDFSVSQVVSAMKSVHPYEEVAYDLYSLNNVWQEAGSGLIGELDEAIPGNQFPAWLKNKLDAEVIRFTEPVKEVKKVAVCGGSGAFLISAASKAGADAYVTGDVKYHEFFDAENRLMICDPGHFESERYTIEVFAAVLSEKFPNFATIFARTSTNPVKYYY